MSWIKDLWDIVKGNRPGIKEVTSVYLEAIKYLKEEQEEQKKIIAQHKLAHPENGKELDEWLKREEKLHKQIVGLLEENRTLREENIFLKKHKKGRSMYE